MYLKKNKIKGYFVLFQKLENKVILCSGKTSKQANKPWAHPGALLSTTNPYTYTPSGGQSQIPKQNKWTKS